MASCCRYTQTQREYCRSTPAPRKRRSRSTATIRGSPAAWWCKSRGGRRDGINAAEDEPMADMNLIPLIDIALTLLIILMVTTAFIKHPGVSLKLPETTTREGAPETQ